jgi:hypothetical protein
MNQSEPILAPTFLFRFSHPCLRCDQPWAAAGIQLDQKYAIASFGELEGRPLLADFRCAWNEEGLMFNVRVHHKKQKPWCRATRIEDSDGLHLWIDTRDTHNIHRAGRFCHQFAFLPHGAGRSQQQPVALMVNINRAKEHPKPARPGMLQVRSEQRIDGYLLEGRIAAAALTGYQPLEHPRLGFCYAVADRELDWQTFTVGPEFPITEDPSLWGTLELVE